MTVSVALELTQSLLTNGARAAAVFLLQTCYFVAIPQLARDIPGGQAGMNAGDSDVSLQLYRASPGTSQFREFQQLDVPGGADAEFFTIDDRAFLATATMRSGSDPNHNWNEESCIFEWDGDKMVQFQCIPTFGAQQWHHFDIAGQHFLALAQGLVDVPGTEPSSGSPNSTIFAWDGDQFQSFQTVPSQMGYNWLHFSLEGRDFLAYADHMEPSYILEWNREQFVHFQTLDGAGGRAFCLYESNDRTFLAFSRITSDSVVYQWKGQRFQEHQTLPGAGGKEFAMVKDGSSSYLVHVKFITGDTDAPNTALNSTIYRAGDDGLQTALEFPTFGGTDVSTFSIHDETYMVITESLTKELRFRQDSHVYRFISEGSPAAASRDVVSKESSVSPHKRSAYQSPEFLDLFAVYTSGDNSIGFQLRNATTETQMSDPMIVATSSDMLLYPGNGQDPSTMKFRLESGGFMELASISHLGPAVASLAQMRALGIGQDVWQELAKKLRKKARAAQDANSVSLWRDRIKVVAFQGREENIAAMINYACEITIRVLDAVIEDPTKLTDDFVRENYLEATGDALGATIPYNTIMVTTFFLVGLDTGYRTQTWLSQYDIDWKKAMVLITGQQGRETAGVTISSNTVAQIFLQSNPDLPLERLIIAPHGPAPKLTNKTADALRQYESDFRQLWGGSSAVASLGESMFTNYPAYRVAENTFPVVNSSTKSVSELPAIASPHDWLALNTRLRVTLEDVRQLLSGCVTDYAARQLHDAGLDYSEVVVPGLDGYDYASAVDDLPS